MVRHILDLLQFHGLLVQSEHVVLLHGAFEVEDTTGRPRDGSGAAGTGAPGAQRAAVEVTPDGTTSAGAKPGGASAATGSTPAGAAAGCEHVTDTSGGRGPAGASTGGAGDCYAAESRLPDDLTQADKDLLGLFTETHAPEVRTVVRVLLCGIIVCFNTLAYVPCWQT